MQYFKTGMSNYERCFLGNWRGVIICLSAAQMTKVCMNQHQRAAGLKIARMYVFFLKIA